MARAKHRGTLVLIEGCALQIAGLAALVMTVALAAPPSALVSALVSAMVLMVFGYGQGLAMAPLSSAVLSTVKPSSAGAGSGMYGTTTQIGNAAGVAAIGAMFFAIEAAGSRIWRYLRHAYCLRCRSSFAPHSCQGCGAHAPDHKLTVNAHNFWD